MSDHWKIDQEWKIKCNPLFKKQQNQYLEKDRKMLSKRRYGKVLKNKAFEKGTFFIRYF